MFTSSDLHQLIHSLAPSEQRAFKLSTKKQGTEKHNYARLFDLIAQQEEYDEVKIKTALVGEKMINNFSVAKAYLYQSILESLRRGTQSKNPEMALRNLLDQIDLLFQRGLADQAQKVVEKAMKKTKKFQLWQYQLELIRWQRQLIHLQRQEDRLKFLEDLDQLREQTQLQLNHEHSLQNLRVRIQSVFLNQIDLRKPETAQMLREMMNHPLLTGLITETSFLSRLYRDEVHAVYARMKGDLQASHHAYEKVVHLWKNAEVFLPVHPDKFLNSHTSFLDSCLRLGFYADFESAFTDFQKFTPHAPRLLAKAFYLRNHLELRYAIASQQYPIGIRQVRQIENGLRKHKQYLSASIEMTFLYNLGVVHYLNQDFKVAAHFFQKTANQVKDTPRRDLQDSGSLLEATCHFEMGNMGILESRIRSIDRKLRLHPKENPYEVNLLKGLKKLLEAPVAGQKRVFQTMFKKMQEDAGGQFMLGRTELSMWLRSHLEGVPPKDLVPDYPSQAISR